MEVLSGLVKLSLISECWRNKRQTCSILLFFWFLFSFSVHFWFMIIFDFPPEASDCLTVCQSIRPPDRLIQAA